MVGMRFGEIYWYDYNPTDRWKRHLLGEFSPSDVGGCTMDVDGDGEKEVLTMSDRNDLR